MKLLSNFSHRFWLWVDWKITIHKMRDDIYGHQPATDQDEVTKIVKGYGS